MHKVWRERDVLSGPNLVKFLMAGDINARRGVVSFNNFVPFSANVEKYLFRELLFTWEGIVSR